jgi:hypothetical protein
MSGLGSAVATAFVASGDGAAGDALVRAGAFAFWLFGSTVQPKRNADKRTKSRDRLILLAPFGSTRATGVPIEKSVFCEVF